jgi:uncharacterized membrane protein
LALREWSGGAVHESRAAIDASAVAARPRRRHHRQRPLLEPVIHAPDLALILNASPVIQLHLFSALVALAIGTALLLRVKGTRLHRVLGWTWVIAMGTTAISSLFIRGLNHGSFSLIHLLSGWTIIALPMAVWAAKRHDVKRHRYAMTGLFVGGLVIAGALTFIPGRLMWNVWFG